MHLSLDELISASKNVFTFSWLLELTWTCIISCMSLNFSQMGLLTMELAALELF